MVSVFEVQVLWRVMGSVVTFLLTRGAGLSSLVMHVKASYAFASVCSFEASPSETHVLYLGLVRACLLAGGVTLHELCTWFRRLRDIRRERLWDRCVATLLAFDRTKAKGRTTRGVQTHSSHTRRVVLSSSAPVALLFAHVSEFLCAYQCGWRVSRAWQARCVRLLLDHAVFPSYRPRSVRHHWF